jgi:PAS domain S-box-containing protein
MGKSFKSDQPRIENSPDAVSLTDANDERLRGSASITDILGYQLEELVGLNSVKLSHPDHSDLLDKPPSPLRLNSRVRHKDGKDPCAESTVAILLTASDVQAILMHQEDIITEIGAEVNCHRVTAAMKRGGWSSGRLK